ncbi:MAG: hypothetical protein PHI35_00180 [Victivallaceae bacterium]|nr:hypothetical protein [Victivallaceae bacterium]
MSKLENAGIEGFNLEITSGGLLTSLTEEGTGISPHTPITTSDSELMNTAGSTNPVTYTGIVSCFTDRLFFAAKGEALANAEKIALYVNDNTAATLCGGASGGIVNADIEMNVLSGGKADFIYGGGKSINSGATVVNVFSGGTVHNVYGGACLLENGAASGAVTLNLSGSVTGSAFGGNRVTSGATVMAGTVEVNVASGATITGSSFVFGGGFTLGGGNQEIAQVSVNWDGGEQTAGAYCGRGVSVAGVAGTDGTLTVVNAEGAFNAGAINYIYGGAWAQNGATATVENVTLNLTGGDYGFVYGGGIALGSNSHSTVKNVTLSISGDTKLNGVFAGGMNSNLEKTISDGGNATVTLSGNAVVTKFVNGEGANCSLVLDNFSGSVGGVSGFESVTIKGATALSDDFQMLGDAVSTWRFDLTAAATGTPLMQWAANSYNEFAGDTIYVDFDDESTESWTLISMAGARAEDTLSLDNVIVKFNGSSFSESWELVCKENDNGRSILLSRRSTDTPPIGEGGDGF